MPLLPFLRYWIAMIDDHEGDEKALTRPGRGRENSLAESSRRGPRIGVAAEAFSGHWIEEGEGLCLLCGCCASRPDFDECGRPEHNRKVVRAFPVRFSEEKP